MKVQGLPKENKHFAEGTAVREVTQAAAAETKRTGSIAQTRSVQHHQHSQEAEE